ncbi:hypothetical protein [Sulfurimonas sp.]|uniref:hypothetical protein n=1 Tax=Sulfurimonas sp. TaxID=2022749 RepID=UPI002AAFD80B|nr:hypothetical protein [Sulfurimonas sp.]
MDKTTTLERRQEQNANVRIFIDKSIKNTTLFLQNHFINLQIQNYNYNPNEAMQELGLDFDLVNQLAQDYVAQIITSKIIFLKYLEKLKANRDISRKLDFTQFRELAHKNLGVVKNLRIFDGQKLLDEMMIETDLDYLTLCVEALEFCAIRLRPKCAYETLRLIEIKSSL